MTVAVVVLAIAGLVRGNASLGVAAHVLAAFVADPARLDAARALSHGAGASQVLPNLVSGSVAVVVETVAQLGEGFTRQGVADDEIVHADCVALDPAGADAHDALLTEDLACAPPFALPPVRRDAHVGSRCVRVRPCTVRGWYVGIDHAIGLAAAVRFPHLAARQHAASGDAAVARVAFVVGGAGRRSVKLAATHNHDAHDRHKPRRAHHCTTPMAPRWVGTKPTAPCPSSGHSSSATPAAASTAPLTSPTH